MGLSIYGACVFQGSGDGFQLGETPGSAPISEVCCSSNTLCYFEEYLKPPNV